MEKSLQRFRLECMRLWRVWPKVNWADYAFSSEKAYICAVFSKIAYLHIPLYEAKGDSIAKIIPCLTYQRLIAARQHTNIREFMQSSFDLPEENVRIVEDSHLIAVITKKQNPDVIIVALRGTRALYLSDWVIDLHFSPFHAYPDGKKVMFHKGFYLALTKALDRITLEVEKLRNGKDIPVYVTGHSLGGALAAILYALAGKTFLYRYLYETVGTPILETQSGYTFGMPRYGGKSAVYSLQNPFHIYNEKDIIPSVPPEWLGFATVPQEYALGLHGKLSHGMPREKGGVMWLASRAHSLRGVRYHSIERYIRRMGIVIGIY